MGETTTEGDEGLRAPGRATTAPTSRRSTARWWSDDAEPIRPATTPPSSPIAVSPSPEDLRAGAQIVGIERRRDRAVIRRAEKRAVSLPIGIVLMGVWIAALLALASAKGDGSAAVYGAGGVVAAVAAAVLALGTSGDSSAPTECTADELAELVGYVAGLPDGRWVLTERGERARRDYIVQSKKAFE